MMHVKTLGLTVVAAVTLLVFAGTASATLFTSPAGTAYAGPLNAASQGHTAFDTSFGPKLECNSTLAGSNEQQGPGLTVKGNLTALSFTNCTTNVTVTALKKGSMEVHPIGGTNNGTVTSSGAEIEVFFNSLGIRCILSTNSTHIGTLTASNVTGGTAVLDIAAKLPRTGGPFLCGSSGIWTGTYKFSTPDSLLVDP